MIKNEEGFTIAQVLIAAGLMGALTLVFMNLMKNMNQAQSFAQSSADEIELRSTIRMILDEEKYCRVSLAGDGPVGSPSSPVVFEKEDIDEDSEGLDISLYLANQDGDARTTKKLNGKNNPGAQDKSKFGKLTINSMKLLMNNGVGANYADNASHTDIGVIRVEIDKKIAPNKTRQLVMDFDVNLVMATGQGPESSGETRILSCYKYKDTSGEEMACRMANKHYDDSSTPKCRTSKGGINSLMARGGQGGYPGTLSCPDGYGVVGLFVRTGGEVDSIALRCQEINYETLTPVGNILTTEQHGGTGGSSAVISCPSGTFAVGIFGRSAARVDQIGLRCSTYDGNSVSNTSARGGGGGASFSDTCTKNTILRQIDTHTGSLVDRIKGVCI